MSQLETALHSELATRSRLPIAMGIAIALTILLTAVSMSVYYLAGFNKLDLSRPDYANERKEVNTGSRLPITHDTTSPLNKQALDDFLKELDERVKTANAYGDFKENSLSDEELGLTP
jgi:hypothetical protein